jgi:hypothetical protein
MESFRDSTKTLECGSNCLIENEFDSDLENVLCKYQLMVVIAALTETFT